MGSLQKTAISSIKWSTLQTIIVGLLGPISLLIKAKFLNPVEFGYLSIIMITIGLFGTLEGFGISQAIIQKDTISKEESSTIFIFNILSCIVFALILYFASPFIAIFFKMSELKDYLPIVSIIIFLHGPTLLMRAYFEKNLLFRQLSIIAIFRNLLITLVMTLFLILDFGVFSVIIGHLVGIIFVAVTFSILAIRIKLFKIKLFFKLSALFPFLKFGIYVSGKGLLSFVTHRLDEIVIGYFLSQEILGFYHFGKNMLEKIRILITNTYGKVLFPLFAKLKNNQNRLQKVYYQITSYIGFSAFPLFGGIAVTAHLFVPIVFGEIWKDSIIVFQVFSISTIFLVLTANIASSLLYSANRPKIVFYVEIVTSILYFILILTIASNGMLAILLTYFSYVILKTLALQHFANSQLKTNLLFYFKQLVPQIITTVIMCIVILLLQHITQNYIGELLLLVLSVLLGVGVYSTITWFYASNIILELKSAVIKGRIT